MILEATTCLLWRETNMREFPKKKKWIVDAIVFLIKISVCPRACKFTNEDVVTPWSHLLHGVATLPHVESIGL